MLFITRRSRYFNVYFLGFILLGLINFVLNKTFFAPRENLDLFDLQVAVFLFAVVPIVLLTLSALSFFSSKVLMEKEGFRPRNLFISLIGVACIAVLILFVIVYTSNTHSVKADMLFAYVVGLFAYFMLLFTATAIYAWLCAIFPPNYEPDYIIVLGSGLIGDRVPPLLASRLDKAVMKYKKCGEKPLFITSGGQGDDELVAESVAMKKYIVEKYGISPNKIITEDKSTSTYENMLFSKKIIDKSIKNAKGIFFTNNFHVFRASMYAAKVKLKAIGVGSKTAFYFIPNAFMREFIGILEMKKWWHIVYLVLYTVLFFFIYQAYI